MLGLQVTIKVIIKIQNKHKIIEDGKSILCLVICTRIVEQYHFS